MEGLCGRWDRQGVACRGELERALAECGIARNFVPCMSANMSLLLTTTTLVAATPASSPAEGMHHFLRLRILPHAIDEID